jgi:uncharacterized small protein (DUF1192 family)
MRERSRFKLDNIDVLKEQISRLMAALEDVNFECQRLEIVNSNLDFQLKEANRELNQNIAVLQATEEENERLNKLLYQKSGE